MNPSIQKKLNAMKAPLIKFYADRGYDQTAAYLKYALGNINNGSELKFYVDLLTAFQTTELDDSALADVMQEQVMKIRQLFEAKQVIAKAMKEKGVDVDQLNKVLKDTQQQIIFTIESAQKLDHKISALKQIIKYTKSKLNENHVDMPKVRSDSEVRQANKPKSKPAKPSSWSDDYVENPLMALFGSLTGLLKPLMDGSLQKSKNIQSDVAMMAPKLIAGVLGGFLGMFMPKKYRKQAATVLEPIINTDEPFTGFDFGFGNDNSTANDTAATVANVFQKVGPSILNAFSNMTSSQNNSSKKQFNVNTNPRTNDFFKRF